MSKLRIWHSSRDVYHCAFRMLRLLVAAKDNVELERLRLLDIFLLYPPIIHRVSMPQALRDEFLEIDIPKPNDIFMQLPSAAVIAQELRIYQNAAVGLLVAKGHVARSDLKKGVAVLDSNSLPDDLVARVREKNNASEALLNFLVVGLSELPLTGAGSLYRRSALPVRALSL